MNFRVLTIAIFLLLSGSWTFAGPPPPPPLGTSLNTMPPVETGICVLHHGPTCHTNCQNLAAVGAITNEGECLACCNIIVLESGNTGNVSINCNKYFNNTTNIYNYNYAAPTTPTPPPPPPPAPNPTPDPPKAIVTQPACQCYPIGNSGDGGTRAQSDCTVALGDYERSATQIQWTVDGDGFLNQQSGLKTMNAPSSNKTISVYTQVTRLASQRNLTASVQVGLLDLNGATLATVSCGDVTDHFGVKGGAEGGCNLIPDLRQGRK